MKPSDKNTFLKWNTVLWLIAMAAPAFFSMTLGSTRFPWPIMLPFLLIGPMLASNKMLAQAMGKDPGA